MLRGLARFNLLRLLLLSSVALLAPHVRFLEHGFLNRLCLRGSLVVVEERQHFATVLGLDLPQG